MKWSVQMKDTMTVYTQRSLQCSMYYYRGIKTLRLHSSNVIISILCLNLASELPKMQDFKIFNWVDYGTLNTWPYAST